MGKVELRQGSNWITFDKEACKLMGIRTASPILVFSVKGQDNVFCFQIRRFNETGNMAVGFAMRPTRFSSKMAIRWGYPPEPEYMMHVLKANKQTVKFELTTKDLEYGTLFYIGEWKI